MYEILDGSRIILTPTLREDGANGPRERKEKKKNIKKESLHWESQCTADLCNCVEWNQDDFNERNGDFKKGHQGRSGPGRQLAVVRKGIWDFTLDLELRKTKPFMHGPNSGSLQNSPPPPLTTSNFELWTTSWMDQQSITSPRYDSANTWTKKARRGKGGISKLTPTSQAWNKLQQCSTK